MGGGVTWRQLRLGAAAIAVCAAMAAFGADAVAGLTGSGWLTLVGFAVGLVLGKWALDEHRDVGVHLGALTVLRDLGESGIGEEAERDEWVEARLAQIREEWSS